ncbi:aminopeptidase P family protein [Gryllotalpicola ginsengisoli]|uniref:aminopeptidase P family protein n=1 Tax=Gryllotalpicola ginsengisoli TaxID=444608 RepID=UPI0003B3D456|nr:aminopeptidase P family protein [Gryllotalpicola ginsengisoli]
MTDLTTDPYRGVDPATRPPKLSEVPAFASYMATGWGEPDRTPPVVSGAADAAAAHRARLSAAFPGRTLAIAAGRAPVRANDTLYSFRPHTEFVWLSYAAIEDAVLVLTPAGAGHDATLYIPKPAYPSDTDFFASAAHGELWVGAAPSPADWSEALGLDVRTTDELGDVLDDPQTLIAGGFEPPYADRAGGELSHVISQLRAIKDEWEIGQLRHAVDLTVGGFAAVAAELPAALAGRGERWLQGTFDRHARTFGNDVGYATIVGSGKHAPTLHWVRCDGPVSPEETLLLDMGVEATSFYTADVTRTIPTSGEFTPIQREVHDLVEKAHRAGLAEVAPGRPWTAFHHAAMAVIAQGLSDWGLLPVSVDEALSPAGQHHRRWLVCGIGHHLGLDVHDCSALTPVESQSAAMAPGMVLTVEPGLYFHAHDQLVPPELRGIGVRIEQDVLVTPTGAEVLDAALPIDAAGLEAWVEAQRHR